MPQFTLKNLLLCFVAVLAFSQVLFAQTATHKTPFDFDGDNKTDLAVYRPSTGYWYILNSGNGTVRNESFGISTDRMVPGDYDGDGKTDIAVFRLSNSTWYVINSLTNTVTAQPWGQNGDQPIAGDFDGDGKTDYAVFRPGDNTWHILRSQAGYITYSFGGLGDIPVRGDFDGDGKADVSVWRPSTGIWYYLQSSDGALKFPQWGSGTLGDTVGTGDYDGDGKTDLAVWRSSSGVFYVRRSSDDGTIAQSFGSGPNGDVPVPGNYDGDNKTDYAVWRVPTATWYVLRSSDSVLYSQSWGSQALGDKLAPAAFVPTGAIDGTVVSNTGAAISGALVEISEQGVFKIAAVTGANGYYSAPGLMASKYELKVYANGYQAAQLTGLNVAPSSTTTGNVVLAAQTVNLEDNFNGSSIDTSKWDLGLIGSSGNAAVTVSQTNQRLKADVPANSGNVFNGVVSKTPYNLRNAYVSTRIIQSAYGFSGANERETHLDVGINSNNQLRFVIASNGGYARVTIDGSSTDVGFFNFSPYTAGYIRIRFKPTGMSNSIGRVYFETSPTGLDGTWSLPKPELDISYNGFALNSVKASLNAGNTGNVDFAAMALFDDFKFASYGSATANAGPDKALTQGTTTTTLADGGSTSDGGTITSYKWTMASKPAGAPDPTIASPTSSSTSISGLTFLGYYGFQLTVTDSNGSVSTDSVRVNVVEPASAVTGGPYTITEDEPVVLDGTMSTGAYQVRWQFGDGREAELPRATHMYMTPGTYNVSLTVTNEAGATSTSNTTVTVIALPMVTRTVTIPITYATLQGALNGEASRDERIDIVLAAGSDSGPIVLPYRSSTKDIVIRTASSSLPAKGIRVSAADVGNLATISTSNSQPAVTTEAGASHYRFVGVQFRRSPGNTEFINDLVVLSDPSSGSHTYGNLPHHFVFDRCIFTNGPVTGESGNGVALKRGLALNSGSTTVMNSILRDFKVETSTGFDAQAIGAWSGTGPYALVNDFLEGSTENILVGGASMKIPYATPSDMVIRGNYLYKPLRWNTNDPAHDGSNWRIKNLFELKHAKNVVFDGNVLVNSWISPNQVGAAMVVTVRDDEEDNPWATIQNVQITNNATDYTAAGINLLSIDDISPATIPGRNISIRNNLWDRVGATVVSGQPEYYWIGLNRAMIKTWINHNTVFHTADVIRGETPVIGADSEFRFDNNIAQHNTSGFIDPYYFANRRQLLDAYVPGWLMRKNVITGANSSLYPNDPAPNGINQNRYPDASTFTGQFMNRTRGDYRLAAASDGRNYATDGTDTGCNIPQLQAAIAGSRAGVWTTIAGNTLAADDFNDNSRDTFTWTPGTVYGNSASVPVTEQNNRLEITSPATTGANWGGYDAIYPLDFTGAKASVKASQVVTNAGGETWLFVYQDTSNLYRLGVKRDGGGNLVLVADKVSGGSVTNVATVSYNSSTQAWWRIRHQTSDNRFYFETSSDGLNWTTQGSTINSFGEELLTTGLRVSLGAGKQSSGATTASTAIFDSFAAGK